MPSVIDLKVPDLGDFTDVPVIEILVKAGDRVEKDAPLVTLESEKATMEVPASEAGVVCDVAVNVGDKVSTGSVIARVETADAPAPNVAPTAPALAAPATNAAATPTAPPASAAAPASPPAPAAEIDLVVPDIGDFADVPVIEVLFKAGERIEREAPLVTLESEKATMDVPSAAAGVVRDVRVKVGDRVSKGTVIGTLSVAPAAATTPAPGSNGARSAPSATPAVAPSAPPAVAAPPATAAPAREGDTSGAARPAAHASPAIRRFARELGVALNKVNGSGPNGRITREDVQSFVKRSLATPAPSAGGTALGLAPWPKIDFAQFGPIERAPLTRIRKISGPNLQRNWVLIPHVTQHDDADITDLEAFRQQLNSEQKDVKVTMLAFIMKGVIAALRKYPDFNSSLDGDELVLKKYYNIGFAADTPGGLVVPVVRDVDRKGVLEVARETSELAAKARDAKLSMRDMQGGTFTISSLGGIGGTSFSPIVNAPEVAILGVSRAAMRPVWDGKAFAPRLLLPLSLSYDHRVIDGAAAARFTVFLAAALADMRLTLL